MKWKITDNMDIEIIKNNLEDGDFELRKKLYETA